MFDPTAVALAVIWALFGIFALVAFCMWLRQLQRRPLSATDLYCSAADEQLDAQEREARRRRVLVAGGGFRVEQRRAPSLSVLGETADRIWPDVKA